MATRSLHLAAMRVLPLGLSLGTHLTLAAVWGGHAALSTVVAPLAVMDLELEAPVPPPALTNPMARMETPARAGLVLNHTHPYPVPLDHARPHHPEQMHLPVAAPIRTEPMTVPAAQPQMPEPLSTPPPPLPRIEETARFTLGPQGSNLTASSEHGPGPARPGKNAAGDTSEPEGAGPASAASVEAPLPESGVTVAARLLSTSTSVYPARAREAEIETDVPVMIVVGVDGRVRNAEATGHVGYGLDEAALQSVRAYRFLPAQKNGLKVAVRMRWLVQFRLR
jgi:periplasmic protein TonB